MELLKFNNDWKHFFEAEKEILSNALKGQKICSIEHIGATSLVMCKTAGTIDLMLSIPSSIDFVTIKNILERKGYKCDEEKSDYINLMYFVRRNQKRAIVATVRLVEQGSIAHRELIGFKFYLKENQLHVKKYNEYRESLIKNNGSISEYQNAKSAYIESILKDYCVIK